jgi:hypothetical protein
MQEIDEDVDVDALQDPNIIFHVRKDDIATKIAGAMPCTKLHIAAT